MCEKEVHIIKIARIKKIIKTIIALVLISLIIMTVFSCSSEKKHISDYQYMYKGMVNLWNFHSSPNVDSLLGFGAYLYNSELILFPRETPSTLQEYYFHWSAGIDYDDYAIYFSCKLSESNYDAFSSGLENFELTDGEKTVKPIYDTEHFSLPTYVLQWKNQGKKCEVLEYVMMDDENHTVVFVYTMWELELIEKNSDYDVIPNDMSFLSENFSIYENYDNLTFDISFLEYLM